MSSGEADGMYVGRKFQKKYAEEREKLVKALKKELDKKPKPNDKP